MRFLTGAIAGLLLAASTTQVAHADDIEPPKVEALDMGSAAVPAVPSDEAESSDLVAELHARRTEDFGLVGVTWQRGADETGLTVQVRLRTGDRWAAWEDLGIEADEGEGGRGGTEPLWVGSADGVAVRVSSPSGERPADLKVATIDPGTTAEEATEAGGATTATNALAPVSTGNEVTQTADGSPTYTARPTIRSRASWGARKNTHCDSPRTGKETRGIVVHHTAGTNSYAKSRSASIVRAVQAYHMKGRDWCDIGYNFLVDKYGQIFEGRVGGINNPVRGAHAGDKTVNTSTMGVSMMGTYSSSQPTAATKNAMVRLIGWRLGTTFHSATGTYRIGKYTLNRIAGHRNVVKTACPGTAAYRWLSASGGLRDRVEAYLADYRSAIKTEYRRLGSDKTGPVYVGETPFSADTGGRKARLGHLDLYSSSLGTFSVDGAIRSAYNALDAQGGALGAPATAKESTSRSDVRRQRFSHGTIYRVQGASSAKGHPVWGSIENRYVELGEESGALGAPRRPMTKLSGGRYRAYFEHGTITRERDRSLTVTGA
jgi:hypothetical protein